MQAVVDVAGNVGIDLPPEIAAARTAAALTDSSQAVASTDEMAGVAR